MVSTATQCVTLCFSGWLDFCDRAGDLVLGVQKDIKVFERMGGDTAKRIEDDLAVQVPLKQLTKARRWRNRCLSYLTKLKRSLNQRDSQDV